MSNHSSNATIVASKLTVLLKTKTPYMLVRDFIEIEWLVVGTLICRKSLDGHFL